MIRIFAAIALSLSAARTLALCLPTEHENAVLVPRGRCANEDASAVLAPHVDTRTRRMKRLDRAAAYPGLPNGRDDAEHRQRVRRLNQQRARERGRARFRAADALSVAAARWAAIAFVTGGYDTVSSSSSSSSGEEAVGAGRRVGAGGQRGFRVATVRTPVLRADAAGAGGSSLQRHDGASSPVSSQSNEVVEADGPSPVGEPGAEA